MHRKACSWHTLALIRRRTKFALRGAVRFVYLDVVPSRIAEQYVGQRCGRRLVRLDEGDVAPLFTAVHIGGIPEGYDKKMEHVVHAHSIKDGSGGSTSVDLSCMYTMSVIYHETFGRR